MKNILKENNKLRYALEILFFFALIAVDLLTKYLIDDVLLQSKPYASYVVLDGIFTLSCHFNTGASFSILSGQITFLTIMPTIVTLGIIALLVIRPNLPSNLRIGLILISAGAMGNVIDRIALGHVRDFIDYTFLKTWFGIDFAVGNVADLFLIGGVILLIVYIIFQFEDKDFYSKKKLEKYNAELALQEENNQDSVLKDGE